MCNLAVVAMQLQRSCTTEDLLWMLFTRAVKLASKPYCTTVIHSQYSNS